MGHSETTRLTGKQLIAIERLLAGDSIADVAEAARVNRRTLSRWLLDDEFRTALQAAQGEAVAQASRRLAGALDRSAEIVIDIAERGNTSTRLRAALAIPGMYAQLREVGEVNDRLAEIEARITT
jgi:transcriptional regulator with XRE-family HTH domain